jgi:hypothetical protein
VKWSCTGHWGGGGLGATRYNIGTGGRGVSGQHHAPAVLYSPGKGPPAHIVQEAGCVSQPVWTQRLEKKILCLCLGSNPDRPVRSHTLYRLSNPAPTPYGTILIKKLAKEWNQKFKTATGPYTAPDESSSHTL